MSKPAPAVARPGVSSLGGYAGLLASGRVRWLVAGSMVARLPSAMLPIGILLLVLESGGTIAAAGLIAGAFAIGRSLVSPLVGALIDRMGQLRVLVGGAVVQAALLVALVVAARARVSFVGVGLVSMAAGAASPPVQACLRALWPLVTGEGQRDVAYAFDATSQELIWIVGPLLLAAIVALGTAAASVVACAVIGCLGVAMFVASPVSRMARGAPGAGPFKLGAVAAPGFWALIATSVCAGFAWGSMSFGLSALAVELGSRQSSGVLVAAMSAGSIAGGLVYGSVRWRVGVFARFRFLLALCAVLATPLLAVRSVVAGLPAAFAAGLPLAPLYAASHVLTGRIAPPKATTEAFTWTSSAFALGIALGTGTGGVVSQPSGVRAAFALACAAPLAAWFFTPFIPD